MNETSGMVYKIPCNDCKKLYIGQTSKEAKEASTRSYTNGNKNRSVKWFNHLPLLVMSHKQTKNIMC